MKKQLLVLGLLLGGSVTSFGQKSDSVSFTRTDTVRAVHSIFSKHRTGGWIWTAIGSAFAIRIASVASSSAATDGFTSTPAGTAVGVGLFGGIPAAIGINKLARFSAGREKAVISEYEAGKALPHYIQRRLKKARYFAG